MVLPGCLFVCHLILLRMCFLFNWFSTFENIWHCNMNFDVNSAEIEVNCLL